MRSFMRRVNRGLLLGLIIFVIFVVYICIDYHNFNSEKDTIHDTVNDYLKEYETVLTDSGKQIGDDKKWSETEIATVKHHFQTFIKKYWSDEVSSSVRGTYKKDALSDISNAYSVDNLCNDELYPGYITSMSSDIKISSIKNMGLNTQYVPLHII